MSEEQYNALVKERPELLLPEYHNLHEGFRMALKAMTPEALIAGRTAVIISRKHPNVPEITGRHGDEYQIV